MPQIAAIATTQVKTAPLSGNGNGVFSAGGMNFMDMIFARTLVTAPVMPVAGKMTPEQALAATRAVAAGLSDSDISLIASDLSAAGIDPASVQEILAQVSAEATVASDTITNELITEQSGEPAAGVVTTAQPPLPLSPAQLQEVVNVLRSLTQALPQQNQPKDMTVDPALIAAPLTPAELTEIMESLAALDGQSPLAALVRIVPALTKNMGNGTPALMNTTHEGDITGFEGAVNAAIHGGVITPALAAQLNAVTAAPAAADPGQTPPTATPAPLPGDAPVFSAAANAQAGAPAGYTPNAAVNNGAPQEQAGKNGAGGSSVSAAASGMSAAMADSLMNSAGWDSIYPDGLEWTQHGHAPGAQSLSVTGTAQFASLVANAHHAATPHPATQMVAAQITKGAAEGETKSMTLKLDPPELGRIEIRMDFGKEKGMKAHLVIEKQETFLMLQRDAHVLERALQDAGISAEDGGLSFELAQDNLFNDGHDGGNRHAGGSGGSADKAEAEEIIAATMTWNVDAETGITHYDILA